MATQASSNAQNENMHVMRGKQIDVKANVPKPEKKDRKERKALADLSNLKNMGSTVLKPSTLKQKASFTGSKTTKKSQTSCILSDEETKKCYEWAEEGIETAHFTSIDMLKHEKDAMDKRVKEEVQMVMSCMKEWNWILYDYASPVKTIDVDTDEIKKLEFEPEILLPEPSLSPTSDLDGDILEEPEIDWAYFVDRCDFKLKENNEDGVPS